MIDASKERQAEYKTWLEQALNIELTEKSAFIANVDGSQILGVVGFTNYNKDNIEIHMVGNSKYWITRPLIKSVFSYVFNQLKCVRCTGLVKADNELALSIDKRLGFIQEGILRQADDGQDVIIVGMLKNECRWI